MNHIITCIHTCMYMYIVGMKNSFRGGGLGGGGGRETKKMMCLFPFEISMLLENHYYIFNIRVAQTKRFEEILRFWTRPIS